MNNTDLLPSANLGGVPSQNLTSGWGSPSSNTVPPPVTRLKVALYAAPYKSDFLKALSKGQNVTEEECLEKIRLFLVNYTATIDVIYEMYTKMNAELNYKV